MTELFAVPVREPIADDMWADFLALISPEKREKIQRFRFEEDKWRALCAEILIRYLIIEKLGYENRQIAFYRNEYGKPYLQGVQDFYFNLSHSGDWVLCGISNREIGVDIEHITKSHTDLAARFFNPQEYTFLLEQSPECRDRWFYQIWSLKESYIKYKGSGLSIPLSSFCFTFDRGKTALHTPTEEPLFTQTYSLDPAYTVASCSLERPTQAVISLTLDRLWKTVRERRGE